MCTRLTCGFFVPMPEWQAGFGAGLGSVKGGIGVLWPTPQAPLTGSRPASYGNFLRHGDEKTARISRLALDGTRFGRTFGNVCLRRRVSRFRSGSLGKRRAMAVGAVLSTWVMELAVLTLVGLVGRLLCSMASGFNFFSRDSRRTHLHWKSFCFCFCGVVWRGAAPSTECAAKWSLPAR